MEMPHEALLESMKSKKALSTKKRVGKVEKSLLNEIFSKLNPKVLKYGKGFALKDSHVTNIKGKLSDAFSEEEERDNDVGAFQFGCHSPSLR